MGKKVQLKIAKVLDQRDVGNGIVRIDAQSMAKIGIGPGDVVEIEGKRKSLAIADRAYPHDAGMNTIRMDGIIRKNASSGIGELVTVSKADIKEASEVVIAPASGRIFVSSPDVFKPGLVERPVVKGDIIVPSTKKRASPIDDFFTISFEDMLMPFFGKTELVVVSTKPTGSVLITENTTLKWVEKPTEVVEEVPRVTYEDIGGIQDEVRRVREMIEIPLKHPELFTKVGIEPPKGVLLYGPPGCGKTLLAKAVANESNAHFIHVSGPSFMSKFYGESERRLREIFNEAKKNAPSIVFFDEIDAIAPKREEVVGEVERRIVAQLLSLMDGLEARGDVIVIGATNRVDAVDPALRRPGRFDREIDIGVPNRTGRKEIFQIHTRNMPLDKSVDIDALSDITHGFVGADIAGLCREAAMHALRRVLPKINLEDTEIPPEVLETLKVKDEDFREALKHVSPSAMREVLIEIPKVSWKDIGGLEDIKQSLIEAVEWPLKHPESFKKMGIRAPLGILLYGPPGCGKTLLAKAVASESNANFIAVKGPALLSKWVGESEKAVRKMFERARQVAPSIVFFDEVDALAPLRGTDIGSKATERVVSQLLTELDGLEKMEGVVVLAATNRPDMLDPALLRPGRFDRNIYVPIPDKKARLEILKVHSKGMPLDDIDLKSLAEKTEGFVGADLESLCREAGMNALRENIKADKVKKKHFEQALRQIKPTMTKNMQEMYEGLIKDFESIKKKEEPLAYRA